MCSSDLLTTPGQTANQDWDMIRDAGFAIESPEDQGFAIESPEDKMAVETTSTQTKPASAG